MKSRGFLKISADAYRIIVIVLGSILSMVVLSFSVLAITELQYSNYEQASNYLFINFLVLGLTRLITWLREKTKLSFLRFVVLFVFNVAIGVIAYFARSNPYFYSLCGGLFCLTIILSRVFKIIQDHSVRSIVLNAIIILLFTFLAIGLFIPFNEEGSEFAPILVVCIIIIFTTLTEVLSNAFTQLKFKTLLKIVFRTFAFEIILGLLTMMVASALVFSLFEVNIPTFADGLWYSFAVVTTIGFGDYVAVTPIGRVFTVLLGIYGIIVVAVITSIIVNFYNETAGKKDVKELKSIKDEEKKK
jgi:hypothetical protein